MGTNYESQQQQQQQRGNKFNLEKICLCHLKKMS